MRKNNPKNKHGFSLIETLIAVSILMIAVTGPLALVQAGLFSSIHQRNQVTAVYLAQEALEYVKSIRDANSYAQYEAVPRDWLTTFDGLDLLTTCAGTGCYVDPHGTLPGGNNYIEAKSDGTKNLWQHTDIDTGAFSYNYSTDTTDGSATTYERVVIITPVSGTSDEVTVTVKIFWKDNTLDRSSIVSTNLFNYQIAKEDVTGDTSGEPVGYMYGGSHNSGCTPSATDDCGDNAGCPGPVPFYDKQGLQAFFSGGSMGGCGISEIYIIKPGYTVTPVFPDGTGDDPYTDVGSHTMLNSDGKFDNDQYAGVDLYYEPTAANPTPYSLEGVAWNGGTETTCPTRFYCYIPDPDYTQDYRCEVYKNGSLIGQATDRSDTINAVMDYDVAPYRGTNPIFTSKLYEGSSYMGEKTYYGPLDEAWYSDNCPNLQSSGSTGSDNITAHIWDDGLTQRSVESCQNIGLTCDPSGDGSETGNYVCKIYDNGSLLTTDTSYGGLGGWSDPAIVVNAGLLSGQHTYTDQIFDMDTGQSLSGVSAPAINNGHDPSLTYFDSSYNEGSGMACDQFRQQQIYTDPN